MDDLISRQAAIDAIWEVRITPGGELFNAIKRVQEELIKQLPTVQPERKNGKWVKARGGWCTPGGDPVWECSLCGKGVHVYGIEHGTYGSDIADGQWVSCPNCGADMRGKADGTETLPVL